MSVSHWEGPLVTFGQAPSTGTNGPVEYNGQAGPNLFFGASGQLDTSLGYQPGQQPSVAIKGWVGSPIYVLEQAPAALAANNIAAAQVPVAGTALTLVSVTGGGVTVGQSVVNRTTGATVTGLLALDGAVAQVTFGTTATISIYDPRTIISRAVSVASVGNDSTATFTVAGFDYLGYPMTETITGANIGTANGKKAFKYIQSVTPHGTLSGSNVTVGTQDVFGFPLKAENFGQTRIVWNNGVITANTGFTAPDTTSPATATTGDVRGTYAVQSASDGTKKLQIYVTTPVWGLPNYSTSVTTGLIGVTQA